MISEEPLPPMLAVIEALERRRALFWTGHVLVEFENDLVPDGPVTMVLDEADMAVLRALKDVISRSDKEDEEDDEDDDLSVLDLLGGLTSEEAEALAKLNLDHADDFTDMVASDTTGKCVEFANWYKTRARYFHTLAAEESRAQGEFNRQQDQTEGEQDAG